MNQHARRSLRLSFVVRTRRWRPSSHRSSRRSFPCQRRRFTHTRTSRQRETLHANPLRLPPDIRSQIVELLADALVSDYSTYPTIPR